jgi:hypothetical protein
MLSGGNKRKNMHKLHLPWSEAGKGRVGDTHGIMLLFSRLGVA